MHQSITHRNPRLAGLSATLLGLALACAGATSQAQTTTLYGTLSNFDVYNDTGGEACGFEIELPGVTSTQIYSYTSARYGAPVIRSTATGTSLFYMAQWDSASGTYKPATSWGGPMPGCTQPAGKPSPTDGHSCTMSMNGCEHFGAWSGSYGTKWNYYWLVKSAVNPAELVRHGGTLAIPSPVWTPVEPAVVGQDPVLVAAVEAPQPAEAIDKFGAAQWMKVFKAKLNRGVALEELLSDNPIVPQNADQIEVSWDLIQDSPPSGGNQRRRRKQGQDNVNVDVRAIVRRYEMYHYTGAYDPVTNEALCADLTCTAPANGELGDYIGAQMAAANIQVQGLKIVSVGPGAVQSSAPKIDCRNTTCTTSVPKGLQVTLTANLGGSAFLGWTGACAGTQLTCTVTVNDEVDVGARFAPVFTLSVSTTNKGGLVSDVGGINCGKTCSAKIASGTVVTLTPQPLAGQTFLNWSGACTGTNPVCRVLMTNNASVQAVFSK